MALLDIMPTVRLPPEKMAGTGPRAYARAKDINTDPSVSEESHKILFGQTEPWPSAETEFDR
jgi:hypothetical protein